MLTALTDEKNSQRAIENGASLIMLKPFDMNELIAVIKNLYRIKKVFSFV
jgi:DNA-binding response OmpR family regulator